MIAFHDRKGRLWSGRLDVAAALRLRDLVGVDVMAVALCREDSVALASDPSRLADMLFAAVLPLADFRGVSDHEFGASLRGRLWGWAVDPVRLAEMLLGEVAAFFEVPELLPGKPDVGDHPAATPARLWGAVWQSASIAGVDPGPLTFGELVALADARRKHDWGQTACLLSLLHNANCGRGRSRTPGDFDPTGGLSADRGDKLAVTPENLELVARIFTRASRN